jgi:ABC-type branched-subunit amino acid transport system substrate-binding protein
MAIAPLRIGILHDMDPVPPGRTNLRYWLDVAAQDLIANGRLDRGVEFEEEWCLGLPEGTAAAVEHAYEALVKRDVLMILGPAVGDNALVATPLADRFRVPTINWAGTERARGDYMFHLQVGSHEDEGPVLARHAARIGARRVAVVHDRAVIGKRYLAHFLAEAEVFGLTVGNVASVGAMAADAGAEIDSVLAGGPDCFVYLGLGLSAPAVAGALAARGWSGPRLMNTSGIRGYDPDFGRALEGFVYVDMHDDRNAALNALQQRFAFAPAQRFRAAAGYDLGQLMAEGLARATEWTRDGVRDGLEQIKWVPAAEGRPGTQLSFGHYERAALHGEYLVLRQWIGGETRQVQV